MGAQWHTEHCVKSSWTAKMCSNHSAWTLSHGGSLKLLPICLPCHCQDRKRPWSGVCYPLDKQRQAQEPSSHKSDVAGQEKARLVIWFFCPFICLQGCLLYTWQLDGQLLRAFLSASGVSLSQAADHLPASQHAWLRWGVLFSSSPGLLWARWV
jgi:hypothetical protein